MSTKIIYHQVKPGADCPDGIAAAYVASLAYPNAEIVGWTYQSEDLPEVHPGDQLVIVDFSFEYDVIEKWIRQGVELVVLDHHKTAEQELSRFLTGNFTDQLINRDKYDIRFDMNECGASMAWKYFFPNKPMPPFLEYVRDRDLWDFALPKTEEIHEAVAALRRTFHLFDMLFLMSQEELIRFIAPIGEKRLAPKRKAIADAVSRHQWEDVAGYKVPLVRLNEDGSEDRLTSDICMTLYRQYPEALFSACIASDGGYSLRSDKNKPDGGFDVGALAATLGGGGHRNASGFKSQTRSLQYSIWINRRPVIQDINTLEEAKKIILNQYPNDFAEIRDYLNCIVWSEPEPESKEEKTSEKPDLS